MIQLLSRGVPEGPRMEYGHLNAKVMRHLGWSAILLLCFLFTDTLSQTVSFQWVTGTWGACQHSTCGYGGLQYRDVRCQMPSGQLVLPNNCEAVLRPTDAQECFKPCTEYESSSESEDHWYPTPSPPFRGENAPRQGEVILTQDRVGFDDGNVEWVVSQWGSCRLAPGVTTCGRNNGIRYRNVTCERKDRRVVMDTYLCDRVERRPVSSEPCELLCRQDCIVTPFSAWSSCDVSCHMTNRTRTRNIVVPPRHRGDHCPPFSEMQSCDNCSETFTYHLGEWGPCTLIGNSYSPDVKVHPIIGHRNREINCLQIKGTMTTLRNCADKIPDVLLIHHQSCIIPQDCQVSTWSSLRPYNSSCLAPDGAVVPGFMIRTRQVLQLPMGDGLACPPNLVDMVQMYGPGEDPINMKPCKTAKWILSSWSVCASVPGYSHCGTGIQSRRAICVAPGDDGLERPVDEAECPQPKPLKSQACQTDCNWDCSVSPWSDWSSCSSGDCATESGKRKKRRKRAEGQQGKRYRTRDILTYPGPGGKSCPHLSETEICEPEPCYHWSVTYGECLPNTRGGCGQGTMKRTAECISKSGNKAKAQFCWEDHVGIHSMDNPPWEECYVPCPDDCVLSEWGSWSQCPDPCGRTVSQGPAIRVRSRRILAYTSTGAAVSAKAKSCPASSALRETDVCPPPLDCAVFTWKVSGWDRCTVRDTSMKCGRGEQRRQVDCYAATGMRVVESRCEERVKPNFIKDCLVECPVDCHVTEWSEWSDCGTHCLAFTARQLLPKQRRQRFIVTYPQNGGLSCPHSLNEERQCLNLPVCETYYWDVSDWSGCILPPIVPLCGEGLRARNVTCRHSNGTEYGLDVCLEKLSTMPDVTEHCYVPCPSECQLSEWTPWGRCVQGCEGKRFRWRKLIGDSKTKPDCRNQNKFPLDEQEDCKCDSLRPVVIGDWSDCILQPPEEVGEKFAQMSLKSLHLRTTNESRGEDVPNQAYCGKGIKFMAISCQTSSRDMEGPGSCSASEYQEAECIIPCPIDCQMTPWTTWSACSVTCGSGVQQRFRRIQTQPENGGRRCPQLHEDENKKSSDYTDLQELQTRVCKASCQYHRWETDDWGQCLPHGGGACGPGTQTRTVGCYAVGDESKRLSAVDSSYCSYDERPPNALDCDLRCPGECVMSDWTEWTPCRQPCNGHQKQTRTRSVLRKPAQLTIGSEDCAPAEETRACIEGDKCFEYSWELSDWTSCLINNGSEACGVGHKERFPLCRVKGVHGMDRVDDYKCVELFGKMTEPTVVSCQISCDNDCLLSDWSDWSICSQSCGLGATTRYRTIVQAAVSKGRKCPDGLEQSRPCFKKGCYSWQVTEWSTCRTQRGVCGSGLQERNVSCIGEDGLPVNSSRCPHDTEKLVLKTRQPCHVPCPGECRLSPWTDWSACFISCQDFQQGFRTGVRSRSRAILANPSQRNPACDENLWEEEACQTGTCMGFQWVATAWAASLRTVQCQRTDGLVVEGGCSESERPPEFLSCDPPCKQPSAYCRDTNFCDCLGLYVAIRENGTFTGCDMNRSTTTPATTPAVEEISTTSIWMYAVIAVGTIFVISVAAALYNMCELFRTGPRPRRKHAAKDGEDTRSGTRTPVATDTTNAKNAEIEEMYKQCQPPPREVSSTPDYQNVEDEDFPPPPPPLTPTQKTEVDGRIPDNHIVPGNHRGPRGDVENGRKHPERAEGHPL